MKDPLASFSAPWIAEEFEAEVVALVRHPAALAGSLKVREWTHPFSHFTAQRSLMEGPLEPFVERLEGAADDPPGIVEQAILLWNCVYSFLARAAREHERIRLVRHEDVARNPHRSFEALFDGLGLDYPQDVDDYVTDQTAPSNSVISDDPGSTARDSRRVVWTWRHRLTDNEIRRVREGTARTASHFYGESDWRPPENLRPGTWEGEH